MKSLTRSIAAAAAALVLSATVASAQFDTNNMTTITFSAPVSLPGVTLPAGSYVFRLADSQVNRNIVQVFNKDRSQILATILAIPAERNEPADETVITFDESPANRPPAIRFWYYPGDKRGQEFAYPKKQAVEIANAAHTPVLAVDMDENNPDSMKTGSISRVQPGADASAAAPTATQQPTPQAAAPSTPAPQAAPTARPEEHAAPQPPTPAPSSTMTPSTPATTPSTAAAPSTPATTAQSQASQTERPVGTSGAAARKHLPKTASPLPLVGFMGLLALAGAVGVRTLRRSRV